jgi:hypothetical protein
MRNVIAPFNPEKKQAMSTRASSLFVRAAAGASVVACAAVFAGVAHAGTPADAVTATVEAATQPAAATVTPPAAPDVNVTPPAAATTVTSTAGAAITQVKDAATHATAAVEPVAARVASSTVSQPVAETKETATNVLSSAVRTPGSTVQTVGSVASAVLPTSVSAVVPAGAETLAAQLPTHRGGEGGSSTAASPTAVASPSPTADEGVASSATDLRPAALPDVPRQQKRQAAQPQSVGTAPLTVTQWPTLNASDPKPAVVDGSRVPAPHNPPGGTLVGAFAGADSAGGLLLFGLVGLLFLLVIPTAVRWLRPALALGLSPAYVATRDRPG